LEYPRNDTQLIPLPRHLVKIKTWGIDWKNAIDKTNEWMARIWTNVKIDKENFTLLKQIVNISKE
jgi:hypothetical protein